MSKIKVKEEILIECSTEEEVKVQRKFLRTQGYHSSEIIYPNWATGKWTLTMYGKWKKFKIK